MSGASTIAVLALLLASVAASWPLARWFGRRAGYVLALFPAAAGSILCDSAVAPHQPPLAVGWQWIPRLGAGWSVRVDALSLVFALVVTWVGAIVLLYAPRYLQDEHVAPARFYIALSGFTAAMTLLVVAGDLLTLYVGWEGTTLTSYVLIAAEAKGRRAARLALLVTFGGGLALLAATLLGASELGTLDLVAITEPSRWGAARLAFLVLLLVAAAVKSAQIPFHFWLPAAMVAPTPVSAYLHAAAMVTAGFYLLARFGAVIASEPVIGGVIAATGALTALFASAAALVKDDFKKLLAYSTISHLGFMISLVGVGTAAAMAGALVYFLAHASYKASLFLVSGVFDHGFGTRSLPELGGAARRLPVATAASGLACLSMMGIAPSLGYLGKEEAFKGLLHHADGFRLAVVCCLAIALALTVAYALRIAAAPFGQPVRRVEERSSDERGLWPMLVGPVLLGLSSAGLGLLASTLSSLIHAAVEVSTGRAPDKPLALWHGATPAFFLSIGIIAAGLLVFVSRRVFRGIVPDGLGVAVAEGAGRLVDKAGRSLDAALSYPAPALHVLAVIGTTAAVVTAQLVPLPASETLPRADSWLRWAICLLLVVAAILVAGARERLASFTALAAVGFLVAIWYVLHGAPQLAAVQLVVDVLSLALSLFVLRELSHAAPQVGPMRRTGAAAVAAVGGVAVGAFSLFHRSDALPPASEVYFEKMRSSHAANPVSAVLSEYRALDTLGEVTVVAVAAVGVVAVLQRRKERADEDADRPDD